MKKLYYLPLAVALMATTALAEPASVAPPESWHARNVWEALGYSALFGCFGILMVIIGFKVFDKVITSVDFEKEILQGNVAAGIVVGAVIIGIAIIIAASMG